jgi:predicted O-methyltransferase YrrM
MTSLNQQKFGAAAADYAASAVHAKGASLARMIALTEPKPSWRVLDVATGAGHTALAFAPLVTKVIASDITDQMLAQAKALAAERNLTNVKIARAHAEDLPFPDMSFDLVTCRLAAHHFRDVSAFAAEAFRVLWPGGTFALVDNVSPEGDDALAAAYNRFEKLRDPSQEDASHWRNGRASSPTPASPSRGARCTTRTSRSRRGSRACAVATAPSRVSTASCARHRCANACARAKPRPAFTSPSRKPSSSRASPAEPKTPDTPPLFSRMGGSRERWRRRAGARERSVPDQA